MDSHGRDRRRGRVRRMPNVRNVRGNQRVWKVRRIRDLRHILHADCLGRLIVVVDDWGADQSYSSYKFLNATI